jgi:hypothetical protein
VIRDHVGLTLSVLSLLSLGAVALMAVAPGRFRGPRAQGPPIDFRSTYFFLTCCVAVPYAVLTADAAKSPIVGNIAVAPLLWLVMLTVILLSERQGPLAARGMAVLAGMALFVGMGVQLDRLGRHGALTERRGDVEQIGQLHDLVIRQSRHLNLGSPVVSVDRVLDYFNVNALRTMAYERHGILLDARKGLGAGIFAMSLPEAEGAIRESDFVVVTTRGKEEGLVYPFDTAMAGMYPEIVELCNQSFVPLRRFRIFDREMTLYVRPQMSAAGNSGGWITSEGLTLLGSTAILRARPLVELRGRTNFSYLGRLPAVSAEMLLPNRVGKETKATLRRSSDSTDEYRIALEVDPRDLSDETALQIHLSFDAYFVPKDLGINADTRRLVIRTPDEILLQRR